jgi:hypothetical protein
MTTPLTYSPVPHRTRLILRWIGDGGLASRPQLTRRFWPHARYPRAAYQYLHDLIRQGHLLTARQTVLGRVYDLYVLTEQGSTAIKVYPPFVRTGWPHHREYAHLLLGQEVRLHLEQQLARAGQGGQILAWRTDYLLRHLTPPSQTQEEIADVQVELRRTATSRLEVLHVEVDGSYYGTLLETKAAAYGTQQVPVLWACLPHRATRIRNAVAAYPNIEVLTLELPD